MALIVQKFGGTSLGSVDRLKSAAKRVIEARQRGDDVLVVVSAMAGETNRLLQLAKEFAVVPNEREYAALVTTGEQVAMSLMAIALNGQGVAACSYNGSQLPIKTTSSYTDAEVIEVTPDKLLADLSSGKVVVVSGFQGVDAQQHITTLGRGGSDVTAVAVAAAINADECQIFTDVDGVFSVDPRLVPSAQVFEWLSYDQLLAFSQFGAKVVQSRAVALARQSNVAMRVLSSFSVGVVGQGTLITYSPVGVEESVVPRLGLTYQPCKDDEKCVEISVIGFNSSNINDLSAKVKRALETATLFMHELESTPDRIKVRIDSPALARCLCVLHSQLGMDTVS